MVGLFVGRPEPELLALRTTARDSIAAGKVTTSFAAPGLSATFSVPDGMSPQEIELEATYALQRFSPTIYGRHLVTKRTRVNFR